MELQWRFRARVAACIDLALCILAVVGMVILTIVAIFTSVALTSLVVSHRFKNQQEDDIYMNIDNTDKIPEAGVAMMLIIFWILFALVFIVVIFDLWVCILLLKATEEGASLEHALRQARLWQIVNIVFLAIHVLYSLTNGEWISVSLVFGVVFRGILLYIVSNFIAELQTVISSGQPHFFIESTAPVAVVTKQ